MKWFDMFLRAAFAAGIGVDVFFLIAGVWQNVAGR